MTTTIKTKRPPTSRKLVRQPAGAVDKRRRPRGLTSAVRIAIDALVFDRCSRADACERADITERALYLAFEKPEVAAHWNRCLQVLRVGERAANFHRLVDIRDQDDNRNAAVKAIQVIEAIDAETAARPSGVNTPGVVINIISASPDLPRPPITIEAQPIEPASHVLPEEE